MNELPLQLSIDSSCGDKNRETLVCSFVYRDIPGQRKVYEAKWNGQTVIVKLFLNRFKAGYHLSREWNGLSRLHAYGLNSPEPLFYGKTEKGDRAIVMEKIVDSSPVIEKLLDITDSRQKLVLLIQICRELAAHHQKGVFQKDLHLGNFLQQGDKFFAIDPAQIRFHSGPLTRKKSICQLASLAACLPDEDTASLQQLCKEYASVRDWEFGQADKDLFERQLVIQRKKNAVKALKKCLRTGKRYLKIKTEESIAVFSRDFWQEAESLDFINRIDMLMDKGRILKNGNTCYVSHIQWKGKDIVIKRYNHKSVIHSLRHTLKKSRARRVWVNGHRLLMLNIATPKPIAYIEKHKGSLVWQSYIITEFIKGQNFYNFLNDENLTEQRRCEIVEQVKKILGKLGKYKISHGDLKQSNILIAEQGPVLTDLDAMKTHKCIFLYKIKRRKDILTFSKYLLGSFVELF